MTIRQSGNKQPTVNNCLEVSHHGGCYGHDYLLQRNHRTDREDFNYVIVSTTLPVFCPVSTYR